MVIRVGEVTVNKISGIYLFHLDIFLVIHKIYV